jgi:cytochrome c nitrite reductase small subunit
LRHSYIFTTRQEPQVIRATPMAKEAIQENCRRCHENLLHHVSLKQVSNIKNPGAPLCWDCHRETPHGDVRSLSATPFARVPRISPVFSEWMNRSQALKR